MKIIFLTILTFCILSFSACAQTSKSTGEQTMEATINVTVNDVTKTATLVNNVATKALLAAGKGKTDIVLSLK